MTTFKDFYVNWYSRSVAFAREYVLSDDDAHDIVQDVFIDLYERFDYLPEKINLVAYLFTSLKNRCIDVLRRRITEEEAKNRIGEEYRLEIKMKFDSLEILDDDLFDEESTGKIIEKALAALPERCRIIFTKHKLDGTKRKDIADELGITIKTVDNQLGIACQKLREILKPYSSLLFFLL